LVKYDKFNEQVILTYTNGDKYAGGYSGIKYVGEWKLDSPWGQGTWTFANGTVEEGIFENNKFLYAKKPYPQS